MTLSVWDETLYFNLTTTHIKSIAGFRIDL